MLVFLQLDDEDRNTHFAAGTSVSVCFLSFLWTQLFWIVLPDLSGCQSHFHYLLPLIFCRVAGELEPVPASLGLGWVSHSRDRLSHV